MSAVLHILDDLAGIGATIKPAGDYLILRAGPTAIPAALVSRIRETKADLLATLAGGTYPKSGSDEKEREGNPPRDRPKNASF